jgi:hypothetical protein
MGGWGSSTPAAPAPVAAAAPIATAAPGLTGVNAPGYGLSKEFTADNAVRMPVASDSSLLAAAKIRRDMMARSGRDSTRLVGTQVYGNTFLGSVG